MANEGDFPISHVIPVLPEGAAPLVIKGYNDPPLKLDPSALIGILWGEISGANHPEALEGYFDHLMRDEDVVAAVKAYAVPTPDPVTFDIYGGDDVDG